MFTKRTISRLARGRSNAAARRSRENVLPLGLDALEPRMLLSAANLFGPPVEYATDYQPCALATGDFNHDGKLDMVTVNASSTQDNGTMSILLGTGNGAFGAPTNIETDVDPYAVVVGDFNSDGFDDIAVANYDSDSSGSTVDIFLGKSNGSFQDKAFFAIPTEPYSMAMGDFNNDHNLDLAVSGQEADADLNLRVFLGDGAGGFAPEASYVTYWAEAVTAADLNNDGNVDLAVACDADGSHDQPDSVVVFMGNGTGTFQKSDAYEVDAGPKGIAAADLDGDGYLDLASTSSGSLHNGISILMNDGDGTFGTRTDYPAAGNSQGVAAGDLDNDGWVDLAIAGSASSSICVKLNDGTGAGGLRSLDNENYAAGAGPIGVVVADFNGDGRLDMATTDNQDDTGAVSVLLGVGPTASDANFVIKKNATFTFSKTTFATPVFKPVSKAATLKLVKIVSLPTHGTLKYKGKLVNAGATIPAASLASLTYVPNKDYDGADSFEWRGYDGTSYTGLASVNVVTIPEVTITSNGDAIEGGSTSFFTIHLNHASLKDTKINLAASGKAVGKKNYVPLAKVVTILAGQTEYDVTVTPMVDNIAAGDLTVIEKVVGGTGYTIGAAKSATVTIVDDEPKISIAATTPSAQFGANGQVASNGHITITRTGSTAANLTLTLVIGGTAKSNTYAPITSDQTKTVTISAGSSFITLDIVPLLNPTAKRTVTVTCKAVTKSPLAANRFSLDLVNKSAIVNILHV